VNSPSQLSPPPRSRRAARFFGLLLPLLLLVVLVYAGWMYACIVRQSTLDQTRRAGAIVVFGAAEYAGKPSPIYRARLEHAAELFRRGLAPLVIITGGAGKDPHFSEGQVGRDFLIAQGLPESHLIAETQGADTSASAVRVAGILRANRLSDCIAVSDGYHIFRIKKMLRAQGVAVYGAPRPDPHSAWSLQHTPAILEEIFKYSAWKLGLE